MCFIKPSTDTRLRKMLHQVCKYSTSPLRGVGTPMCYRTNYKALSCSSRRETYRWPLGGCCRLSGVPGPMRRKRRAPNNTQKRVLHMGTPPSAPEQKGRAGGGLKFGDGAVPSTATRCQSGVRGDPNHLPATEGDTSLTPPAQLGSRGVPSIPFLTLLILLLLLRRCGEGAAAPPPTRGHPREPGQRD